MQMSQEAQTHQLSNQKRKSFLETTKRSFYTTNCLLNIRNYFFYLHFLHHKWRLFGKNKSKQVVYVVLKKLLEKFKKITIFGKGLEV